MKKEKLKALYKKYSLTIDDVFKHSDYIIITRSGIEKIQAIENIQITYNVIQCDPTFCVVKANASAGENKVETFGSARKGATQQEGNCKTWYVMEMAEKRSLSRAVLKLTGFYQLGVFGEDESEDFKNRN